MTISLHTEPTSPSGDRVFIVDDDEDVRDALAMLMRAAGLRTTSFVSARDFLQRFNPKENGCLVLDIRMPGMTGIELQAELHKRRIRLPIVFLTAHGDVPLAVKAMKAGAADFIQKPLDEHRLVMAVMNALKVNATPTRRHDEMEGESTQPADPLATLSSRETEVLDRMIAGRQSREIAAELCISLKTVEFHRANIRRKLGATNLADLFRRVFGKERP
jgi:FixJ family two-component response regulator